MRKEQAVSSTKASRSRKRRLRSTLRQWDPHQPRDLSHRLGRYDEAEAAQLKAIALQPQSANTYLRLAIIQILRGNSAAAVELAKQEADPFWRTYALALSHFANGDLAEADAALKKLIDENADDGSQIAVVCAKNRRRCSSGSSTDGLPATAV